MKTPCVFAGTFCPPVRIHQHHEDLLVMVPTAVFLLAAGAAGAGALPIGMADLAAFSHCRHRRGRSPGAHEDDHPSAGAVAGRGKPRLETSAGRARATLA